MSNGHRLLELLAILSSELVHECLRDPLPEVSRNHFQEAPMKRIGNEHMHVSLTFT